jgi:putative oxidoreductase
MLRFLRPFNEIAYTAMRVVVAFLYWCHGVQKVFGAFGGHQMPLGSKLGVAGMIELVLGPLIGLGLATSWAAFVASGEMAAAFFTSHFPRGGLPVQNGGEIAVAFCFVFLYIATRGGGTWSLDRILGRKL